MLGALMYDAGGFFLPFAVTGTAILASGILVLCTTEVQYIALHPLPVKYPLFSQISIILRISKSF